MLKSSSILENMSSSITSSPTKNSCNGPISVVAINHNENSQRAFTLLERLNFEIYRYSSYAQNYTPENVLVDCPHDQTSRWSAYTNTPPQFLTLKLRRPAIVKKIKFGKFEKSHVCNIKKFRVFGGLDDEHMILLLEGGLKNDNIPEVFSLRCTKNRVEHLPILYIKIVPLLSWGPSFNFSIWYIELHGQDDPLYICARMKNYNTLREIEIIKLCLKHFRQQGYMSAFKALQDQTNVLLEHPLISHLHKHLVVQGDFKRTECFIKDCIEDGLMDDYLIKQDYKHAWHLKLSESEIKPGNRGGHQLLVDSRKRLIYLYGGWDGYQDLSDLWRFSIDSDKWSLLCERSELSNGPTPRSCHKMIFDPVSENIFMLGRYLDSSIRTSEYIKSDFYLYDTQARNWMQISDDTSQVGGPQLIYDHQMCIDADKRMIYVFGGKILTLRNISATASIEPEYSGLYSYHIATNTWSQILVDCHHASASQSDVLSIRSRITHCMVFHNKQRKLYIYGGQRGKEDLDEFLSYDVDTQAISVLNKDQSSGIPASPNDVKLEPSPGYTLRATIDCDRDEIYVFSSLSKVKDRRDLLHVDASNSFWVYSLDSHKWSRIYHCRYYGSRIGGSFIKDHYKETAEQQEPCPRYAHQFVFDEVEKMHYLFGGNPGINQQQQLRLDDLWLFSLEKPKREALLTHCRYLIRKLCYEEMTRQDPLKAMLYLRHQIAAVIDHNDPEQLNNFHKLASLLFESNHNSDYGEDSKSLTPALNNNYQELDLDVANATEKFQVDVTGHISPTKYISLESNESATTSGISDAISSSDSTPSVNRMRTECLSNSDLKLKRDFLFNQLVRFMPSSMVQPGGNLSDFVVI